MTEVKIIINSTKDIEDLNIDDLDFIEQSDSIEDTELKNLLKDY